MKKTIIATLLSCFTVLGITQQAIEITDQTLKINGEEYLYFGFTAGDEVIFSMEEVNGKELKEVEVLRYPDQVVYANLQVGSLEKRLRITEEGVYQFRLKHSGLGSRICRVSIGRIPAAGKASFNTAVAWVEQSATEAAIIGYETKQVACSRRVVAAIDTTIETILNRTERVHSSTNLNGNTTSIGFSIPEMVYEPNIHVPDKITETVSWAYAISTGTSGDAWYKSANTKAAATNVTKTMISTGLLSTGYGALAILAIEGVSMFSSPPAAGDNVLFGITHAADGNAPTIAEGNSVAAFGKVTQHRGGNYTLQLTNDNIIEAINVDVKVIAVIVTTTYQDEEYEETQFIPIKEQPAVKPEKVLVPVIGG
ncbi:hypothetical protein [Lewinella cohaerens]|uniref:hypothetical protein n=1 Tax=Lewinella cohaerens TaxID=70995 RepID=UPI00037408FA|nr:hypothetical protein [Lewinella cohaerens]